MISEVKIIWNLEVALRNLSLSINFDMEGLLPPLNVLPLVRLGKVGLGGLPQAFRVKMTPSNSSN